MHSHAVKKEVLNVIYRHADWTSGSDIACRKGCAACCTQHVTMTTLEGEMIIEYLQATGRGEQVSRLLDTIHIPKSDSGMTTNRFARLCLNGREIPEHDDARHFTPCFFLENDLCTIYPARPFGCRSFFSLKPCAENGSSEMRPVQVTLNTVFMQIIEHLDQGRPWGRMAAVLLSLCAPSGKPLPNLQPAEPLPGFLVPPDEEQEITPYIDSLFQARIFDTTVEAVLNGR